MRERALHRAPCRQGSRGRTVGSAALGLIVWFGGVLAGASERPVDFELIPEMETLDGILVQPWSELAGHHEDLLVRRGIQVTEQSLRDDWDRVRAIDLVDLSRFKVEAMEGWSLPEEPGEFDSRLIGRDPATGDLFLEIRGPRLPPLTGIVFRYLYLFAQYDPLADELESRVVTIRGWAEE